MHLTKEVTTNNIIFLYFRLYEVLTRGESLGKVDVADVKETGFPQEIAKMFWN